MVITSHQQVAWATSRIKAASRGNEGAHFGKSTSSRQQPATIIIRSSYMQQGSSSQHSLLHTTPTLSLQHIQLP